jgi:hypothetical protein
MTHVCCPSCRLRFTRAAAAYLEACPTCGESPQTVQSAERILGFRLVTPEELVAAFDAAAAVTMPLPDPEAPRP